MPVAIRRLWYIFFSCSIRLSLTDSVSNGNARVVVLDLKGSQYRGTLFPCATAMILTVVTKKGEVPHMKLDRITDEFCRLVPTGQNALDQMSALIVQGDASSMENYQLRDVDVERIMAGGGGAAVATLSARNDDAKATMDATGLQFPSKSTPVAVKNKRNKSKKPSKSPSSKGVSMKKRNVGKKSKTV